MLRSLEIKAHAAWDLIIIWGNQHPQISRLVSLSVALIVFLIFLPASTRVAFWEGLLSHRILASMLLVFSLLAISLVWSTGQNIDTWGFLLLNLRGPRPLWLDRMMSGFTQIGSGMTALGIAIVIFLTGDRLLAYDLMLGTLTLWLLVELMKLIFHRSRPFVHLTQARIIGRQAIGRSFPSGHTSQAFFLAMLLTQFSHPNGWGIFLLYAAASLVGITRMYVGAHYPRDVLAGAILGSVWGLLVNTVNEYMLKGIW